MTGTERKVFQKYYPPDYDPRKLPKVKREGVLQFVQRVMTPFNMTQKLEKAQNMERISCNTCGEYIYKGKKFNMRRETAEGEFYLGLKIFRFYFRCPNCLAEITFKTDLENCDYANEHGATRLFEAHKLYQEQVKEEERIEEEEKTNPMKMLEKRTKMSKAEMDALGDLEELREHNRKHATVDYEGLLHKYKTLEQQQLKRQEEQDEEFVRSTFRNSEGEIIKRVKEEDDDDNALFKRKYPVQSSSGASTSSAGGSKLTDEKLAKMGLSGFDGGTIKPSTSSAGGSALVVKSSDKSKSSSTGAFKRPSQKSLLGNLVVIKKKPKSTDQAAKSDVSSTAISSPISSSSDTNDKPTTSGTGLASLLGDYGSGSSGSEGE